MGLVGVNSGLNAQCVEQRFHPNLYCADYWDAYRIVIPEDRWIQSKSGTSRV
jgi:hypothetical protein